MRPNVVSRQLKNCSCVLSSRQGQSAYVVLLRVNQTNFRGLQLRSDVKQTRLLTSHRSDMAAQGKRDEIRV
jgi:hypothetical protein